MEESENDVINSDVTDNFEDEDGVKIMQAVKEKVFRMESGRFKSDISESSLNSIPELQILERLLQVSCSLLLIMSGIGFRS